MPDPTQLPSVLCLEWLSKGACDALEFIGVALNSGFSTALLGSLAGAFAGAIAAQRIVENSKLREELLKEFRNTNAATMTAATACNSALALKRQHVKPLYDQFHRDKAAVLEFNAHRASGQRQGNTPFHFTWDMRTFTAPVIPIESLQDLLFNKVSIAGRPLALVCAIDEAYHNLRSAIALRDAVVEKTKSSVIPEEHKPFYYFGFQLPNGNTNQEYPDLVDGIQSYLDDMAFFTQLLCADLTLHAKALHARLARKVRESVPRPTEVDFEPAKASGLIPPDSRYDQWLRAFPTSQDKKSPDAKA
jgi:hypothetical protein